MNKAPVVGVKASRTKCGTCHWIRKETDYDTGYTEWMCAVHREPVDEDTNPCSHWEAR